MSRRFVLAAWLVGIIVCGIVIARTTFTTDLSAFLPQSPTPEQQVLLDQLQEGVVSRLILVGLEGADAPTRAVLSKEMAGRLRGDPAFAAVNNGEPVNTERDQAYLFGNRYLLSPAVTPERFTAAGLHEALAASIDMLASSAGMMMRPLLPRDPSGEMLGLLEGMNGASRPAVKHGVWASRDGARAVLLVQTRATGADIDGQQAAMLRIRQAFDAAVARHGAAAAQARMAMSGPGVFSVQSRQTIESEVTRLSLISTALIVCLLLLVYRSFTALALGLVPVLSGALVGVAAVSLGFGLVHGITLGFGTTLIGESVDYSIYLFVQSRQARAGAAGGQEHWMRDFWPTIRLGVLTSIVGFASLLLSSFPGLAQLGLYSIAGLVTAATVTRLVLPRLLPEKFQIRDVSAMGQRLARGAAHAPQLRWPLLALALAACVLVFQQRDRLWNAELSSLSPVSAADQATDARLRADLGAPDVRYMVVVPGRTQEEVLAAAEQVAARLEPLVQQGVLAAYESPSRYLPSIATQRARQASLPGADLAQRLSQAAQGLPVKTEVFAPFLSDVAAARTRAPLERADLEHTSLALAVDSLLFQRDGRWTAILPLTAAASQADGLATGAVRQALAASGQQQALFVDLKAESDHLYSGYLHEALLSALAGVAAIAVLLLLTLRSPLRVLRVLLPLAAAVVTVVALLALSGQRLTILHLIGLLLVVAVGSNYALFFSKPGQDMAPQTLTSLLFANLTTVAGFGVLGFSEVPVLQAIGATVGPGALLALLFAAVFAGRKPAAKGPA